MININDINRANKIKKVGKISTIKKVASQVDKQDRRSFFWKAGTVVSAAAASTTVGASSLMSDESQVLREQLQQLEAGNAIRQLHQRFTTLLNEGAYEELAGLFFENAVVELNGERLQSK